MPEDALIVIDMLVDFVTGDLKCDRAKPMVPRLKKLVDAARELGVPVIFSNDEHEEGDYELGTWGPHAMKGTPGAEAIPELGVTSSDYIIPKKTYSGFYETNMDATLKKLGVKTVYITGLHTNICDRHTAAGAYFRGYKVVAVSDATEAFAEKDHKEGLEYLKTVYSAEIKTVGEIITGWKQRYRK
jgi:nicotinamidase-related amidase